MARSPLPFVFEEYSRDHSHPKNKLCHYIGIPMILFAAVGLLGRIDLPWAGGGLSLALPAVVAAVAFALRLSPRLSVPFAGFLFLSYWLAGGVPASLLAAGFVLGWVFQLVGHYRYEKKSPAFFENLLQLLVGPLWIIESLTETRRGRTEAPRSEPLGR